MAEQKTTRKRAPKAETTPPAGDADGKGAEENAKQRVRLDIPNVGKGQKVTHDTIVSAEVLAEHDAADRTRIERAGAIWGDNESLTSALFRKLQPLLREPINPRYVVTTGPAEKGKPFVTTGIQSVQVQIDRLTEVLGADHFRILARHEPDGRRCRVHVVIGNDLQWCTLNELGDLQPFTLLDGTVAQDGAGIYAGVQESRVMHAQDGWGGHERGTAPADIWKGSFTNAAKLAIARVGPGNHVYLLDFEDDPHQPEASAKTRQGAETKTTSAPGRRVEKPAAQNADETDQQVVDRIMGIEDELAPLRKEARDKMLMLDASVTVQAKYLAAAQTEAQIKDVITKLDSLLAGEELGQ